jgi:hypothetical protein
MRSESSVNAEPSQTQSPPMSESALGLVAYLTTAVLVVIVLYLWIRHELRHRSGLRG